MLHRKIESVSVHQSIPGRILNYGTLVIHGTGGGQGSDPQHRAAAGIPQCRDGGAIGGFEAVSSCRFPVSGEAKSPPEPAPQLENWQPEPGN